MASEVDQKTQAQLERELDETRAALDESLNERNRLWEELHRREETAAELEHYRQTLDAMEQSLSWRLTAPLRIGKSLVRQARSLAGFARRRLASRHARR